MLSTEIYCYTAGGNVVGTSSHLPGRRVKMKANFTVRLLHLACTWRIATDWTPAVRRSCVYDLVELCNKT